MSVQVLEMTSSLHLAAQNILFSSIITNVILTYCWPFGNYRSWKLQ